MLSWILAIIADRRDRLPLLLAASALVIGLGAWAVFLQRDLILTHYDAKAHLVVARRVFDNLTPGWKQIGAVWLPLPHLLNMLPVQMDALYRTGFSASLISMLSFATMAYAIARLVIVTTGSRTGAIAGVALIALNPNLLYIQSTPMTEPLLLALTSLFVLWLYEWVESGEERVPRRLGWITVGAVLTRYEAWPIVAAGGMAAAYAWWRRGAALPVAVRRLARLAAWPAIAVAGFMINSRITVGSWFVSEGFFVPDPLYQGHPMRTLIALWWGTHQLSGYFTTTLGAIALVVLAVRALTSRERAALLIPLAAVAAGALPFVAFFDGHPFRIRYMIPLVAASAMLNGITVGRFKRAAPILAAAFVASALIESPPWRQDAPMLLEAQWDRPASMARRKVTACLEPNYRGEKVLASMGSLAHYMQELSRNGFSISDFIHEGNGVIWELALEQGPAPHAGWMLVEEQAEGGDVLAGKMRQDATFAAGMTRMCEGGGVALYRRTKTITTKSTKTTKDAPNSE
jgi:hypothetical protein